MGNRIQDRARGRWTDILRSIGLTEHQLSGRHSNCPICEDGGGKDRFRFDDKGGNGSWFCNRCKSGEGVEMVKRYCKVDFLGAKAEIEKHIGSSRFSPPKAQVSDSECQKYAEKEWLNANVLNGDDPASKWLANRGISPSIYPASLRWTPRAMHRDKETKNVTYHCAMLAKFTSADGDKFTIHRTYLTEDGFKAKLGCVRKMAPGPVPQGGAIRLAPAAKVMGIATGIETSYSCMIMFRVPVWATFCDNFLLKWKPPEIARRILIFGDNDESASGQMVAWGLAYRLKQEGYDIDVRIPEHLGQDFNDVHMEDQGLNSIKPARQVEEYYDSEEHSFLSDEL